MAKARSRPRCSCRTGASPTTISNPITTSSNICAACRARPAICAGMKIDGGNVFEGPRQREYPNPPMIRSHAGELVRQGDAQSWAITRSPGPSANVSQSYINPGRRRLRTVPLLRLLRAVRLRGQRQGERAFHRHPARRRRRRTLTSAPTPGFCRSISTAPGSARKASPIWTPLAASSSSRAS